jgi:hypothetical protein
MTILSRSSDKLWALPLLNNSKTTAFIRLNQEKPTLGIKQPLNKMTMKLTPTTKHLSASKRAADSLFLLFALFAVTAMATPLPEASLSAVIYVDKDAAGANNGSSWGDAYTELADAIKNHSSGEVWVAAGTYKPLYDLTGSATPADPRDKTFFLKNNMAVYGGFSGSETAIAQRNITANPTILSGDIGVAGNTADNAYHVVWARNVNNTAVLDGFTVSQGRANGAFATHRYAGGGILLGEWNQLVQPNAVIRNCTLSNNFAARGGAMAIYGLNGVVSPLIENCTFASNSCSEFGAAILFGAFSSTTVMTSQIINCSFIQNTSQNVNLPTALHLGAQNNGTISPSFQSCKFVGNSRIYLEAFSGTSTTVSPVFENCIFSSNGEIRTFASSAVVSPIFRSSSFYLTSFNMSGSVSNPSFTNVIIWGGTITNSTAASISYSLIPNASCPPGFTCGAGMKYNTPPFFENPNGLDNIPGTIDDNLRLYSCSPAVDAGTALGAPTTDLDGQARPFPGTAVDMGAYEYQGTAAPCVLCFLDQDGDGFGDPFWPKLFSGSCGAGYVSNTLDCDDTNPALNPGTVWYLDMDNDGYYTGLGIAQCYSPGTGYRYSGIIGGSDCNDADPAINPGATETCNGVDDNCDGTVDEGLAFITYYQDADGDGFGNPSVSQSTCDGAPTGYIAAAGDCDDGDPAINPGATETCNGVDDNCNGTVDEGLAFITYYQDADGDGFGNPSVSQSTCDGAPAGYITIAGDCDDTNPNINPAAVEIINGVDDNCDGLVDNVGGSDSDGDGFPDDVDCRPFDPNSYPGAPEICGDGVDNNCDGIIDEPLSILLISKQNVSCNGGNDGSIEVAGSCGLPPYSYNWGNGATTSSISNLPAGQYMLTITDNQGLVSSTTIVVLQPSALTADISTSNVLCHGSATGSITVKPKGGTKPYDIIWSTGATSTTITGLTAGPYSVTITDANGCSKVDYAMVEEPPLLEITNIGVAPSSNNPQTFQLTVTAVGGTPYPNGSYRYRRCNSGGSACTNWQVSNVLLSVPAGNHLVQVRDKNNCISSAPVTVGNNLAIGINGSIASPANNPNLEYTDPQLVLYPTPTTSELWLALKGIDKRGQEGTVEVFDIAGSMILRREMLIIGEEPVLIDVSKLAAGVYVLFLRGVDVSPARFVVQRL